MSSCAVNFFEKKYFWEVVAYTQGTGLPHALLALRLSRGSSARIYLLPVNALQLLPQPLCSVPAQAHTCLEEWWFTRKGNSCVNKGLGIPKPALLVSVEPLGFFGRWILDEAFRVHGSWLVLGYLSSPLGLRFCPVQLCVFCLSQVLDGIAIVSMNALIPENSSCVALVRSARVPGAICLWFVQSLSSQQKSVKPQSQLLWQ